MKKVIFKIANTFLKLFLYLVFFLTLVFFTNKIANSQGIESLYILALVPIFCLFIILFYINKSNLEKDLMAVLIFRNIAVFFFFFGLIGNASWGFISTREAFLIDCIYGIMFFSSPFMILVSYIIPFTKKRYFSITFILAFLMLLSFISAIDYPYPDRGKISSMKYNMNKIQTSLEMYSVAWENRYPESYQNLKIESLKNNYPIDITNPYNKIDKEPVITMNNLKKEVNPDFKGKIIYLPTINNNKITSYSIYGIDGYGDLIKEEDDIFYLSSE